jgi:uncharacterized membrane protein
VSRSPIGLYLRAFGIGAVAGLRSMTAPALFSYVTSHRDEPALAGTPLGRIATPQVAGTLCVLAVGELIADKLPKTPSRTVPPSVLFRALSGGVIGAAVCAEAGRSRAAGAILGVAGAVAATYGAYHLRQATDHKTGLPDPVVALVEDAIAIGGGLGLLRR